VPQTPVSRRPITTPACVLALLLVAGLAHEARASDCTEAAPTNACIAGGGSPKTDCPLELRLAGELERDRRGMPRNRAVCFEGDPRCDVDPDLDNASCTVALSLCINNADPRLACTPSAVTAFELRKPNPEKPRDAADAAAVQALEGAAAEGFGLTVTRRGKLWRAGAPNATPDLC